MTTFSVIVSICSGTMTIAGLLIFLIKPIRDKVLKTKQREEAQKKQIEGLTDLSMSSALNTMTEIYYKAMERGEIKQWAYDSFCNMYDVYKALGGNHWSARMNDDLKEIPVIPN